MSDTQIVRLEALLRTRGAQSAGAIATALGISQPTFSRLLSAAGPHIVRIGRARASRYALAREVARAGSHWPLHRIDPNGRAEMLGELHALHGDAFYYESDGSRPALLYGEFAAGLLPGLPWFLDDQRPQGFLGRAFAHRVAADINAPDNPLQWRADDIVLGLLRYGHDQPGDLVLGEASLQRALHDILTHADIVPVDARTVIYPRLAEATLGGEPVSSSAGGEQPKFAITVESGGAYDPVIVKFSDRVSSPTGRRWADLLICEHHACELLHKYSLPAARSELIEADSRMFLQSTRFDRTASLGRRGLVSLAALDAAYYGHGSIDWWRFAPQLQRDGWLSAQDTDRLRRYGWFGMLIANNDMHLSNAALHLADNRPFSLAPAYDMLPMRFRPAASGEIVAHRYEITMATPEHQDAWRDAAVMAREFWHLVGGDGRVSEEFRRIADDAGNVVGRALAHVLT